MPALREGRGVVGDVPGAAYEIAAPALVEDVERAQAIRPGPDVGVGFKFSRARQLAPFELIDAGLDVGIVA